MYIQFLARLNYYVKNILTWLTNLHYKTPKKSLILFLFSLCIKEGKRKQQCRNVTCHLQCFRQLSLSFALRRSRVIMQTKKKGALALSPCSASLSLAPSRVVQYQYTLLAFERSSFSFPHPISISFFSYQPLRAATIYSIFLLLPHYL